MFIRQADSELQVDLPFKIHLKSILDTVECYENNPNYETYKATLEGLIREAQLHVHPKGFMVHQQNSEYLVKEQFGFYYCIVTLGQWIEDKIKACFDAHEYLEGMMFNALADNVLYEATNEFYNLIKVKMSERSTILNKELFLTSRFEPGNSSVPLEAQNEILRAVQEHFTIPVDITTGYMLSPSKTLGYVYGIVEEDCSHGIDHDCSSCSSTQCKHRKYIIQVEQGSHHTRIQGRVGENVLSVLRNNHFFVEAPCNGKGLCGKCKVIAKGHRFRLTAEEKKFLSQSQISEGYILACLHTLEGDLNVSMDGEGEHPIIEDTYAPIFIENPIVVDPLTYGIAVDIGTTTLALSLIHLQSGKTIAVEKRLNPQKAFGADVISRIMYVNTQRDDKLTQLIRTSILQGIESLVKQVEALSLGNIQKITLTGNTTMIYLLLGLDPEKLAVSPFTTIDLGLYECNSKELFDSQELIADVTILPWISAYVGGDIVAGVYATQLLDQQGNFLLVDIGTNGEMVLKKGNKLFCAATAAGPAFEGANIRCGMGSVHGAVCEIKEVDQGFDLKVLGDVTAKGLCGSALIDAISLLLQKEIIENTGYLEEAYMFNELIGIFPEDVRQVQLAKAAIAAGIEVLLHEAKIDFEELDALFLAGGFGSHLNIEHGITIGLIPEAMRDKVVIVGNASLAGGVKYLQEMYGNTGVNRIIEASEYIELSTSIKFNELYVMHMMFGGDL